MRAQAVGVDLLLVFDRLEIVDDDRDEEIDHDEDGDEHEAAEVGPGSIWNSVSKAAPSVPQCAGSTSRKKCTPSTA